MPLYPGKVCIDISNSDDEEDTGTVSAQPNPNVLVDRGGLIHFRVASIGPLELRATRRQIAEESGSPAHERDDERTQPHPLPPHPQGNDRARVGAYHGAYVGSAGRRGMSYLCAYEHRAGERNRSITNHAGKGDSNLSTFLASYSRVRWRQRWQTRRLRCAAPLRNSPRQS